jgi:8-oxo-dGTP diphosphatase
MIVRPTARLLVFDPDGRLLLFQCRDDANLDAGFFWIAPGGGVEQDETDEQAALRELREETGIESSAAIGPCVLEREGIGRHSDYGDQDIVYRDRYFTIRLSSDEVAHLDPALVARAGYIDLRWWSLAELESTTDPVWPEGLATVIRRIATPSGPDPG